MEYLEKPIIGNALTLLRKGSNWFSLKVFVSAEISSEHLLPFTSQRAPFFLLSDSNLEWGLAYAVKPGNATSWNDSCIHFEHHDIAHHPAYLCKPHKGPCSKAAALESLDSRFIRRLYFRQHVIPASAPATSFSTQRTARSKVRLS